MDTKFANHPACNFRPRSFAQAEVGCQITHCGCCNGHILDESDTTPCRAEAVRRNHAAWEERCLEELFDGFMLRFPEATARDAFMFAIRDAKEVFHEYNLGDCGMSGCPECHHEMED